MSKWKLEINDDGDEVLIFDENHSLVTWNLEDTDKCCYEILHLIIQAPELLRVAQRAMNILSEIGIDADASNYDQMQEIDEFLPDIAEVIALAKNETLYDPNPTEVDIDW